MSLTPKKIEQSHRAPMVLTYNPKALYLQQG